LHDCAHAACKWAAIELRGVAATLQSEDCAPLDAWECNLFADLHTQADLLETSSLADCVAAVVKHPGEVAIFEMGSTAVNKWGSLDNVILNLGCDISAAVIDDPPVTCIEAAHTQPFPEPYIPGTTISTVTFGGVFGDASTGILYQDYTVYSPSCGSGPCYFELSEFDIELDDVSIGHFVFHDITLTLDEITEGTRTGTAVTIPSGYLAFDVSTVVEVDGDYPYGEDPYDFVFFVEDLEATYDAGVFKVQSAVFDYAHIGVIAVLNTEPPVF
jgi:hypothetical protein